MKRRSGYGWLEIIVGVLLILLGIFTLIRPTYALTGAVIIYGIIAVITGIADIVFYIKIDRHMGFVPTISLISGLLSVMAGVMLLAYPAAGTWVMSLLVPIWFIAHCISRLSHLNIVRMTAGNFYYYFELTANIIGLILGIIMILNPIITIISVGYIVGIYLIILGVESIILALSNFGSGW